MAYSKIKKTLFILLCFFILIFPFWCVRGLCAESEDVETIRVDGLSIDPRYNYFISSSQSVTYFNAEPGYIYHIYYNYNQSVPVVFSDDVPATNVTYENLFYLTEENNTFNYISNKNETIVITYRSSSYITVTREKLTSMDGAVSDLVQSVGINSIWNIFDISIDYIVIIVLFAFGCYIIFRIIKKVSRGKEGL